MKIFLSSRMKDVLERKAVVDAIYLAGHTTLYIEAERYANGGRDLKALMDSMLDEADAFIGVYYDSLGKGLPILGQSPRSDELTPVEYELFQFLEKSKLCFQDSRSRPVILYHNANKLGSKEIDSLKNLLRDVSLPPSMLLKYERSVKLFKDVFVELDSKSKESENLRLDSIPKAIVYQGENADNLLQTISEFLYSKYRVNLKQVFGWSIGDQAILNISASFPVNRRVPTSDELKKELDGELHKKLGVRNGLQVASPNNVDGGEGIGVHTLKETRNTDYAHIEIRCIDMPGQLNAVCKGLNEETLAMSQIHLSPAPPEFPRQTIIAFRVPFPLPNLSDPSFHQRRQVRLRALEIQLRDLVGVQTISSRFSDLLGRPQQLTQKDPPESFLEMEME